MFVGCCVSLVMTKSVYVQDGFNLLVQNVIANIILYIDISDLEKVQ